MKWSSAFCEAIIENQLGVRDPGYGHVADPHDVRLHCGWYF